MKHKRTQGIVFLAIGIFLISALMVFMWSRVLTDLLSIVLVFVVVICACINLLVGLLLIFGKQSMKVII